MGRKPYPKKFRNQIALMKLIEGYTYRRVAQFNRVSVGTVHNCVKQYKADHPILLKVRTVISKLTS